VLVTVGFTSSEYSGCNVRDETIDVMLKASRIALLPFMINVTITSLVTLKDCTTAISTDPLIITFYPGERRKPASLRLKNSLTCGGAFQRYKLKLHLSDSNKVAISISSKQQAFVTVKC